jgi:hypothetical protein
MIFKMLAMMSSISKVSRGLPAPSNATYAPLLMKPFPRDAAMVAKNSISEAVSDSQNLALSKYYSFDTDAAMCVDCTFC